MAFSTGLAGWTCLAQIDPVPRQLLQIGYNQPVEGKSPIAGYAFYYWNQPDLFKTNTTLRLAIAPVYLDSEIGFRNGIGPNTDFAIGLQGGGFADSHSEIRRGRYIQEESFTGHGGDASFNLYHRFNPAQEIPLNGTVRIGTHFTSYQRDGRTAPQFKLPTDEPSAHVRAGLRWGGVEPVILPTLAMELSAWYDGRVHAEERSYGYNDDRRVEPAAHLFWTRAVMAYTLPENRIGWQVGMTAGASINGSRLDAFRIGGALPFASELPLNLPGYFFQELSAQRFLLFSGQALIPVSPGKAWNIYTQAATAVIDYLPGLNQPGYWHSGLGAGIVFKSPKGGWQIAAGYAYGIDAIRTHGRGAQSVSILMQYDFTAAEGFFLPGFHPTKWRGFDRMFGR